MCISCLILGYVVYEDTNRISCIFFETNDQFNLKAIAILMDLIWVDEIC